jgi:Family of unknown function (DUF5937)/Helix-turn-helix domain
MLLIRMSADDVALTRFAVSPLGETVAAMRVLLAPGAHAVHLQWVRWAREELAREPVDLGMLPAMLPRRGARPEFLTPAPDTRLPDFEAELARLRRTRTADVRASLGRTYGSRARMPASVRPLHDDPRRGLADLTGTLDRLWRRLVAPYWPRLSRVLDADIVRRSRRVAEEGIAGLAADLHPDVHWTVEGLALDLPAGNDEEVQLGRGGLVLVPSVFNWPGIMVKMATTSRTTLRYPARGAVAVWEQDQGGTTAGALVGLLGRPRTRILQRLAVPATTVELARDLGVTPSAVSQHLTALLAARLVARERQGRSVLYLRTPLADELCAG